MTSPRASPKRSDLAIGVGQRPQELHRRLKIIHDLIVRNSAFGTHMRGDILRRRMAAPVIQVRRNRRIPMMRELPRALPIPLIPTRHMMRQHHPRMRTSPQRTRKISIDPNPIRRPHSDRLRNHPLIHISRIQDKPPSNMLDATTTRLLTPPLHPRHSRESRNPREDEWQGFPHSWGKCPKDKGGGDR